MMLLPVFVNPLRWLAKLLPLILVTSAFAEDALKERIGYAYDARSGTLAYSEHHQEWWQDGRMIRDTVTYRNVDDIVLGEKHIDFQMSESAPDFRLRNVITGHSESARTVSNRLEVSFREIDGEPMKMERLMLPEGAIVDAGFDRFIERNWTALIQGETLVRPFLVPSRLEFLDFRIKRTDDGLTRKRAKFELSIDSSFLRLFVSDITVTYDTTDRRLLEYVGISNIRDAKGDNLDVEIRFDGRRSVVNTAANAKAEH